MPNRAFGGRNELRYIHTIGSTVNRLSTTSAACESSGAKSMRRRQVASSGRSTLISVVIEAVPVEQRDGDERQHRVDDEEDHSRR